MSSSVESRIVTMKFDNKAFQDGAAQTLSTLDKLKQNMNFSSIGAAANKGLGLISSGFQKLGLQNPFTKLGGYVTSFTQRLGIFGRLNPFKTATAGAGELNRATQQAGTQGMTTMEGGISHVSKAWVAMATVAITAISNITTKLMSSAGRWAKGFTFGPLIDGLKEYELNLKSVQVIQANTDKPLPVINDALDQLNQYSDQTIYNFAEMAKNIGTFTAAGVDLKTSVSAIKGIANMAALSGSNSQQASTAMYQLSQALAAGKVGLMDWNSVVNAGMGGKKLQNALAQTAIAMGEIDKAQVKGTKSGEKLTIMGNSFRESIMAQPGQESWLSSEILQNSLASLDGRYSRAALSAEKLKDGTLKYKSAAEVTAAIEENRAKAAKDGVKYTDEQFKALQKLSTSAFKSATEVKTLGQVFDVLKETIGSGWAASFRNVFGDLKEAKSVFTPMSETLNKVFDDMAVKRNEMLAAWKKEGGRDDLIEGLKSGWKAVSSIMGTVRDAFREVFPAQTAKGLLDLTARFKEFMAGLVPGKATLESLKSTMKGVFAIFSIIGQVIGGVASMFGRLFGAVFQGSGSFLKLTAGVGEWLFSISQAMKKGQGLKTFFQGLGDILAAPIRLLSKAAEALSGLFDGFSFGKVSGVSESIGGVADKLTPLEHIGNNIKTIFKALGSVVVKAISAISNGLANFGETFVNAFNSKSFDQVLKTINTALFGGLILLLRRFSKQGLSISADVSGGMFQGITDALGEVSGVLVAMQNNLKADTLMKIAIAIGVLTASIVVLASIDGKKLAKAMTAIGVGMGIMVTALVVLAGKIGIFAAVKLPLIAAGMVGLASSMLILSGALKVLAGIEGHDIAKGLVAIAIALQIMQKAMVPMAANAAGMVRAGAALVLVSVALNGIALAVRQFGSLDLVSLAKGLGGIAASMLILAKGMAMMPKGMIAQAAALTILATALNGMAIAVRIMGSMDVGTLVKGLLGTAAALNIIAQAMRMMPKNMVLQAAALVAVAGAMTVMGGALRIMGGMSVAAIAKSLITLAGALGILAIGLKVMTGSVTGAAALVIAAGALAILAPVLLTLGAMSWGSIIKGLIALAGTFAVVGAAGLILAPVTPVIMGLGAALLMIGAGAALAGAGLLAAASAIGVLVGAGSAGIGVMIGALKAIINLIPTFAKKIGQGIVQSIIAIGKGASKMTQAFSRILASFLKAIIKNAPLMAKAFMAALNSLLRIVVQATPKIAAAGMTLVIRLLEAMRSKIGRIVVLAADIIVRFMNALGKQAPKLANAGMRLIIRFINATADAIDKNSRKMGEAGGRLAIAIVRGMANGIAGGAKVIKDAAIKAAKDALSGAMSFLGIKSPSRKFMEVGKYSSLGFAEGIRTHSKSVKMEAENVGKAALGSLKGSMQGQTINLADNLNLDPTIKPVLDLSQLKKDSGALDKAFAQRTFKAGVSFTNASLISAQNNERRSSEVARREEAASVVKEFKFEQNNYSPKELSPIEIYRNTRNQFAMAKEALTE